MKNKEIEIKLDKVDTCNSSNLRQSLVHYINMDIKSQDTTLNDSKKLFIIKINKKLNKTNKTSFPNPKSLEIINKRKPFIIQKSSNVSSMQLNKSSLNKGFFQMMQLFKKNLLSNVNYEYRCFNCAIENQFVFKALLKCNFFNKNELTAEKCKVILKPSYSTKIAPLLTASERVVFSKIDIKLDIDNGSRDLRNTETILPTIIPSEVKNEGGMENHCNGLLPKNNTAKLYLNRIIGLIKN